MYLSTAVFGVIVVFFLWRGYQKGFIGSVTRILGWVAAYPAAVFLTLPLAKVITEYTSLDGLLVYFIAGGSIFFVTSYLVSRLLNYFSDAIPDASAAANVSKAGGAVIGVFVGGFVGLLVGYAINLVQHPVVLSAQSGAEQQSVSDTAPAPDTFIDATAKKMVSTVAATAVDVTLKDPVTTRMTRAFTANPQAMFGHMGQVANSGKINDLLLDEDVKALLDARDVDALLVNDKFLDLMEDGHMRALITQAGNSLEGKPPRQVVAEALVNTWARTDAVKNDPRVQAILADPELQQQAKSANKLPLLTNPKVKELAEIVFSDEVKVDAVSAGAAAAAENFVPDANSQKSPGKIGSRDVVDESDTTVYQWTDEHGIVHFSDKPAEN